jgi:hypothetical protein
MFILTRRVFAEQLAILLQGEVGGSMAPPSDACSKVGEVVQLFKTGPGKHDYKENLKYLCGFNR